MSRYTPEQVANLKKLAEALRSGQYEQGRQHLVNVDEKSKTYCCLGVAGCLLGMSTEELERERSITDNKPYFNIMLSPEHAAAYGFTEDDQFDLANNTNDSGFSFMQIAEAIEIGIRLGSIELGARVLRGIITFDEAENLQGEEAQ